MKNIFRIFFVILLFFVSNNCAFSKINFFKKKKQESTVLKMVETKQEWEVEAQNIPLKDRIIKDKKPEIDKKKYYVPEQNYILEKYNYPQGHRELDITGVKNKTYNYPYIVADIRLQYAAYPRYYYSPDNNQISSNFYVEKLDASKSIKDRILDYKHNQLTRTPIIEAGTKDTYDNMFNGLTLVDWSQDSKKLLIKEKVGSLNGGIYKTYLYVHFMQTNDNEAYTLKLNDIDEILKRYFMDYYNTQIVKYKYNIEPLGFALDNDNVIIFHAYIYDKTNKKIFMGTWGYDCIKERAYLFSKDKPSFPVSTNGLILKEIL